LPHINFFRECYLNSRKIFPYARPLIGKHVLEAIAIMSQSDKKVGIYLLSALKMVKSHAVQKGLDEDRLFVHAIITNKQRRSFRLRYHAKSKMGRMKSDVC
jgi:ribosomal protein L22